MKRYLGIDAGAETIKIVEMTVNGTVQWQARHIVEQAAMSPGKLTELLDRCGWSDADGVAVTGRLARRIAGWQVPVKQAQSKGFRHLFPGAAASLVSIGSRGFSVLELRHNGIEVYRENSRCSQGTGNFLRQLVERFSLSIEDASKLCAEVERPQPLSGRCPVILKTDMTHLANKGCDRAEILAGLFDAVCENVMVLIKPGISPGTVYLIGGVTRAPRVQAVFREALGRNGMEVRTFGDDTSLYLEAMGCALIASEQQHEVPALDAAIKPPQRQRMEMLPPLAASMGRVKRMPPQPFAPVKATAQPVIVGFDIGSTGSKAVAIDADTGEAMWQAYRRTLGDPVGAARDLLDQFVSSPVGGCLVKGFGATGSGREIAGSLLTTCYGKEAVFVLNEIAAHAAGALHCDPRVDTIFEIGGQDAKYIRLAGGRVVDCAMNEACSAGTGSFIEEQGRKFSGIATVGDLARVALEADAGVSLGQHCSVFMAEIIDEAVAEGIGRGPIVAGLYDSVIQNYLHRVKGSRPVGSLVLCQGMPFCADALAAAVARQTGSEVVVPPNPGTVGALGIALLAARELNWRGNEALGATRFLESRVENRDTFVCASTSGCGDPGNRCKIECLRTVVSGRRQQFTWGGGCALHDKGTRRKKLPDRAPDPFREREELVHELVRPFIAPRKMPRAVISDVFMLKELYPFFAAYLHGLGFDLVTHNEAGHEALKRGIRIANVPFCAPMQLFHGVAEEMMGMQADHVVLPMVRGTVRQSGQTASCTCPMVQACPDILKCDFARTAKRRIVSPVIDIDNGNYDAGAFPESCKRMARGLGVQGDKWRAAFGAACEVQRSFDLRKNEIGSKALAFCAANGMEPVVVLGRSYTIYNQVLNSNVPAILREQGVLAVPADCYPVDDTVPVFDDMYWGYGQHLLRAAHQIRRTPGQYSVFCSNYSCGPDSFTLHFYAHVMEGKPFAIIETDGHAGDAGTKTRVEAFLHCVNEDRRANARRSRPTDFRKVETGETGLSDILAVKDETILIPHIGAVGEVIAAFIQGMGVKAEVLAPPDGEALAIGRRVTSGKECLPLCLTLGSVLRRVMQERDQSRKFIFGMARTRGPCRLGAYNPLNNIVLGALDLRDRVRIWSPKDTGYFEGCPPGSEVLVSAAMVAGDMLIQGLLDARPGEPERGMADAMHRRNLDRVLDLLRREAPATRSWPSALWQVANGRLFGIVDLLDEAALEYATMLPRTRRPRVLMVGEIYVRCTDFSNDDVARKLEDRGLSVRLAPFSEWMEYCGYMVGMEGIVSRLGAAVQSRIHDIAYQAMARHLSWPRRARTAEIMHSAAPYLRRELEGEAVLTVGSSVHEWDRGDIDAVVSVGPLECMPNKIAEAQFFHATEQLGLPSLTLSYNGDPVSTDVLDNFAYEVRTRFEGARVGCGERT